MLDDLISRPLDEGDVLSNANTLIYMGKIRDGNRISRGLYIAKHRGSAVRRADRGVPDWRAGIDAVNSQDQNSIGVDCLSADSECLPLQFLPLPLHLGGARCLASSARKIYCRSRVASNAF